MAYRSWAKWTLFSLDSFDELEGQFPIENVTQNLGAQYEDAWTLNRQEPISQWIHGTSENWSFETRLRQLDSLDDIRPKIKWLLDSVRKDTSLGRPPLYVWSWGSIELSCYITSLGGIQYEMSPANELGQVLPREVRFTISLRKYVQFDVVGTDPNSPFALGLTDTLYVNAKIGETYEALAAVRYGNPDWGDLIRRRHPSKPFLTAGTIVALPKPERFLDADEEPESSPLERTEEGLNARQALFELRGGSKVSFVV
jgi:hypothetical protein